jgi:hypothetical protein
MLSAMPGPIIVRPYRYVVTDYGAVGDGVTDNLAIFNAAMDDMQNHADGTVLFVPPGTYGLSNALQLRAGISIVGASKTTSKLLWLPAFSQNPAIVRADSVSNCGLRTLTVTLQDLTVATSLLLIGGICSNLLFDSLSLLGASTVDGVIVTTVGGSSNTLSNTLVQAAVACPYLAVNLQQGVLTQTSVTKVNYAG